MGLQNGGEKMDAVLYAFFLFFGIILLLVIAGIGVIVLVGVVIGAWPLALGITAGILLRPISFDLAVAAVFLGIIGEVIWLTLYD